MKAKPDIYAKFKSWLARANGCQMARSAMLRKLHCSSEELNEVANMLRLRGDLEVFEVKSGGRPQTQYRLLPPAASSDSRLENIGKLFMAAVREAMGNG